MAGKLSKEAVIEKLKAANIQFDENAGYSDLLKLLPKDAEVAVETVVLQGEKTVKDNIPMDCAAKSANEPVKQELPLMDMPEVPCGANGVADLNRRVCIIENRLGLANWKI